MTGQTPWQHRFWRTFYDRVAFAYDAVLHFAHRLRLGSEERIRREIITPLRLPANARMLEIGCGTAANRDSLPAKLVYIGLDSSRNMLRRAIAKCTKQNLRADFIQADARELPLRAGSINLVLAMGVLQHTASPEKAIVEMRRVTASTAQWLVIDELSAAKRILPHLAKNEPVTFGEYFITHVRWQN